MEGLGTGLVDRDGSTMPQTPSWFHPRRCGRGAWTPCVDQTCHSKKPTGHWARVALLWPRRRPRTGKGVKWSEGQSTDPNEATQLFLFHGSSELCKTSFALRRSSSARARAPVPSTAACWSSPGRCSPGRSAARPGRRARGASSGTRGRARRGRCCARPS